MLMNTSLPALAVPGIIAATAAMVGAFLAAVAIF